MKLPIDLDEVGVAGGVAGAPINVVRARTVDLLVPAEAEIVIEGLIDTEYLEPEGPFGESHGHVAPEEFNMPMRVTAITHRKNAIVASYLSQVTPSESSAIKRVSYEPMFLAHLRNTLGIRGVKRVKLHERMTALRRMIVITVEKDTPNTEIWRALYGATCFKADCGKICIAVDDDIDPDNSDAIFWAMAFRMNPRRTCRCCRYRSQGHGPEREHEAEERGRDAADGCHDEGGSAAARAAQAGIHGARGKCGRNWGCPSCGRSRRGSARRSATGCRNGTRRRSAPPKGGYLENGSISEKQRRSGLKPETRFRPEEK